MGYGEQGKQRELGLIDAVNATLPMAEHRWCARHIYANWSKKWPGGELQKKFWICAWSSFEEEFKDNLTKLGEVSKKAAEDLMRYPPNTWCRAYQSDRCCSNMVDNNLSESFNSNLVEARHKPIISMLEDIRALAMTKIREKKRLCDSWIGEWSPIAMKDFNDAKEAAIGCRVLWNGATGYEIGEGEDKHTVLLDRKICTCRAWKLTGIPCCHAISAMSYSKMDPMSEISMWYHKSTYEKAYAFPILPVPGSKFWHKDVTPIQPPPSVKLPGRPRKKRVRASNEPTASGKSLSRKGQIQHCSVCKGKGHKKTNCPGTANEVANMTSSSRKERRNKAARRQFTKPRQTVGLGCHIDSSSGQTTIDPGLSTEQVIMEGTQSTIHDSDPVVRGPIPNERELRSQRRELRSINLRGEGSGVRQPTALPFKAPGLQWKGAPSVTTRQLLEQRETRNQKRSRLDREEAGSNAVGQ